LFRKTFARLNLVRRDSKTTYVRHISRFLSQERNLRLGEGISFSKISAISYLVYL